MLRSWGATQITLRVADAARGDTSSQLGLTAPAAEDVQIYPAVVRCLNPVRDGTRRIQATFSGRAMAAAAEQFGVEDVASWLLLAQGILYRGKLMRIESVVSDHFGGSDYLYQVTARE